MKNVKMPKFEDSEAGDEAEERFTDSVVIVEHGDSPYEILQALDARLKQYGLEIQNYKRKDDLYMFDIIDHRAAPSAA